MPARRLPVRPDLDQLRHQAKDLLRAARRGDPDALADVAAYHPERVGAAHLKLADAQLALARSYDVPSWPRLVLACRMADAIWRDDADAVRALATRHPHLVREEVLFRTGGRKSNWGPPLTYAANLGRDRIIALLHALGATDLATALDRAALQGQLGTARTLHTMMGRPRPDAALLGGAAYTLSATGTALLFELGVELERKDGRPVAPADVVLETDGRDPAAKHAILALYAEHGVALPDTPPMAVHRGRIDLLEAHLRRDPGLLRRTFAHEEIYPPALGCHDEVLATHGTPLAGATLLHMAVDYAEWEIARWLLEHGMDVDARAAIDADGFGGHTALFATVVSQPNFWTNRAGTDDARFTRLLLDRGADPNARASLRKQLHLGYGWGADTRHEYRDVTPLGWGRRFHRREFVSEAALRLIEARGGAA